MAKHRSLTATKLSDGTEVIVGGNLRKVRSPLNHQQATPTKQADGSTLLQTPNGQRFKVTRIK